MTPERVRASRSIRLRLTAWYTLLLAVVLLAAGFTISAVLEHQLRADLDSRLEHSATDLVAQINRIGISSALSNFNPTQTPGTVAQIIAPDGEMASTIPNLGVLPFRSNQQEAYQNGTFGGVPVRTYSHPLYDLRGNWVATLVVGESLEPIHQTLTLLHRILIAVSIAGILCAGLIGWWLAGRALRPIERVTETAAAIAAADGTVASLATRLNVPGTGDEVSHLAETFNAMLDRLEASFTAQQRFVSDASHELRTPLTAIRGNVDVLMREVQATAERTYDPEQLAALEDIRRESARMGRLISGLLTLARADASTNDQQPRESVRLDLIAQDAVRTARTLTTGQELTLAIARPVRVIGDADRLIELLLILLENAIRHTPAGGTIGVTIAPPRNGQVHVTVADTGEGIAPEHLAHIFERFYRIDSARHRATGGTGLGLAIANAIVTLHHGQISIASTPGRGTTFTINLPALPGVVRDDEPVPGFDMDTERFAAPPASGHVDGRQSAAPLRDDRRLRPGLKSRSQ